MSAPERSFLRVRSALSALRRRLGALTGRLLSLTRLDRLTRKERWLVIGLLAALLWGLLGLAWEKLRRAFRPAADPAGLYEELRRALPEGEVVPGENKVAPGCARLRKVT